MKLSSLAVAVVLVVGLVVAAQGGGDTCDLTYVDGSTALSMESSGTLIAVATGAPNGPLPAHPPDSDPDTASLAYTQTLNPSFNTITKGYLVYNYEGNGNANGSASGETYVTYQQVISTSPCQVTITGTIGKDWEAFANVISSQCNTMPRPVADATSGEDFTNEIKIPFVVTVTRSYILSGTGSTTYCGSNPTLIKTAKIFSGTTQLAVIDLSSSGYQSTNITLTPGLYLLKFNWHSTDSISAHAACSRPSDANTCSSPETFNVQVNW